MACQFFYNGEWYSEAELEDLYDKDVSAFLSGMQSYIPEGGEIAKELAPETILHNAQYNQKQGIESSKASPKTIEKIKEFLSRVGVSIKSLGSNNHTDVNGVANSLQQFVSIAEGKENVALPEEAAHILVDMIEQANPSLFNKMMNKIGDYTLYRTVLQEYGTDSSYQLNNNRPDIRKIKKETIGKLLAEHYIQKEEGQIEKPELLVQTKTWWDTIIQWIKDLLGIAGFNPFEEATKEFNAPTSTIQEANDSTLKPFAEQIAKNSGGISSEHIQQLLSEGKYKEIVDPVFDQLSDENTYYNVVDRLLNSSTEAADTILALYNNTYQQKESKNPSADELFQKFQEKIDQYQLKKVVNAVKPDEAAPEDEVSNYYTVSINNKEERADRTTDWAKRKNQRNTGGKDPFANAKPEQKEQWKKKALNGINIHYDIENLINSSLNTDGTIKPRNEVDPSFKPATYPAIYNVLIKFLLGSQDQLGWLYQFPQGTKFRTEQMLYNEKAKDVGKDKFGRASTLDLLVALPNGDIKIYDWKAMGSFQKDKFDQVQSKKQQHALQLGDYKNSLKEAYGAKGNIEAFTIPIAAEYKTDVNPVTLEKTPYLTSIQFGKINIKDEERTYLLPVVPEDQSTGNPEIDKLVRALKAKYTRIYKKPAGEGYLDDKIETLNQLSAAIRHLQITQNFAPLALEAKNFEENVEKLSQKYKDTDFATLDKEQLNGSLNELLDAENNANYYSDLDEIFISQYGTSALTEKQEKILINLRQASSKAKESKKEILSILNKIALTIAEQGGVSNFLSAEKEVKGIINSIIERSSIPNRSMKLFTKILTEARSNDKIVINRDINSFGEIYQQAQKLAKTRNKDLFSLIANTKDHTLIPKTDPEFWKNISQAKKDQDKAFFLKNIDLEEYKRVALLQIEKENKKIDERTYSTDDVENNRLKIVAKRRVKQSLDLVNKDFDGWYDPKFRYVFNQAIKEEDHYSEEFKELLKPENKPLLDMWNLIFDLNTQAKDVGYLKREQSKLFIPFVLATTLQRLSNSNNKLKTFWESTKDQFTVLSDEQQSYGKVDEETGEQNKNIPTYFTFPNKDVKDYSQDLLRVVPLYIEALQTFRTSKELEDTFLMLHKVEENKGHLEVDKRGRVLFEGNMPRVFEGNKKNADLFQKAIENAIYGINEDTDTALDLLVDKFSKNADEETKEKRKLSVKKAIQQSNILTQQLAVGLKASIAIPNYVGAHLQSSVNAGRYYKYGEYATNHNRIIASAFTSKEGNIKKALIDLLVPLNDDVVEHKRRQLAKNQSTLKWLSTWSFNDMMMSTNRWGDIAHELTNALTWMDNTIVVDGTLQNIRQYLRSTPEFLNKYKTAETGGISVKEVDKLLETRVKELKEKAITKIAKFNESGYITIPGIDPIKSNFGEYRNKIVEYGRYITGQMSHDNKMAYRSNIIAKSFMMFKNWIPKQLALRVIDIHKNDLIGEWEYGRTRLFFKTWAHLGLWNIRKMRHILSADVEGIQIMRDVLEKKKEDYFKKTGQELEITEEEFFDMMRQELRSSAKEWKALASLMAMVFAAKAAAPPDDEEDKSIKNQYRTFAKWINKSGDEIFFYWNPLSAESITRGTILPSLGILTKVEKFITQTVRQWSGVVSGDEKKQQKAHPFKYLLDLIPIASQFENELLPLIDPEAAQDLGIKLTSQSRAHQ